MFGTAWDAKLEPLSHAEVGFEGHTGHRPWVGDLSESTFVLATSEVYGALMIFDDITTGGTPHFSDLLW